MVKKWLKYLSFETGSALLNVLFNEMDVYIGKYPQNVWEGQNGKLWIQCIILWVKITWQKVHLDIWKKCIVLAERCFLKVYVAKSWVESSLNTCLGFHRFKKKKKNRSLTTYMRDCVPSLFTLRATCYYLYYSHYFGHWDVVYKERIFQSFSLKTKKGLNYKYKLIFKYWIYFCSTNTIAS